MANVGRRQNLTDAEAQNAVTLFDALGRVDLAATNAANDQIFAPVITVTGDPNKPVVVITPPTLVSEAAVSAVIKKNGSKK